MKLFAILGVAGALYAGAGAFLWAAQERLVFHPRSVPDNKRKQLQRHAVEFQMPDGAVLRGWLRPAQDDSENDSPKRDSDSQNDSAQSGPAKAKPACELVVYFGGNAEEISANMDEPLPARGAQLFVNYRGYGDSDGAPSAEMFEQDAVNLFDQATARFGIAPEKTCAFGRSLGTHMAAVVAAKRPVGRVVMISPFDSVLNIARARYPVFPVAALLRHPFATANFAPSASAPALFVLAERDWIVPRARSDALIKLWRGPKQTVVVPGASHNTFDSPEYREAVSSFLNGDDDADRR